MRLMRGKLVIGLAVAALAIGAAPAAAGDRPVERGIVQSLSSTRLTLRSLDGSTIALALDARTRFRLNGRPASVGDLRPGHVAEVVLVRGSARVVRAFGSRSTDPEAGVLTAISRTGIVVTLPSGVVVTIAITPRTRIRLGAVLAGYRALRVGLGVQIRRAVDGSAQVILVKASR